MSTVGTALSALLSDAAPSGAAREKCAPRRRQTQSETIANLFASGVRHTSVTKTGGKVREQLVIRQSSSFRVPARSREEFDLRSE